MARPEGIYTQLYYHPETYHRARYYGSRNGFILWVDVMPHRTFRPLFVRPMMRADEPKMAFMATFNEVDNLKVLCVYVKEWGYVTGNDWQLIATSKLYKGAPDDWDRVFKFARKMMHKGIGAIKQKKSY